MSVGQVDGQELAKSEEPTIREILTGSSDNKRVRIKGWLQNTRSSGGIVFLQIRDGSGVVQATVRKGKVPD
ncbi:MAG TPA: OB-fold nucleic acid binding domain-containing protein, partial [Candidatus Binatus sp.]|nr:OB-fold nucleic acid binding domain-containing protein [Candidatus Binatus sp.]